MILSPTDAGTASAKLNRGTVMAVLGCCFLVVMMDSTILNVALQTIQQDLGASTAELQWSLDSYILFYAALMFTSGILADSFGRRRVLIIGLVVFAVASAFTAFADGTGSLIFWRGVMGVGASVVPPTTLALINNIFVGEERTKAIGIWSALGGLSIALGPIVGGFLLEHFWWGSVFLINVPVVACCAVLLSWVVPESRVPARPQIDLVGLVLSILGIGFLVYGVIQGGAINNWTGFETLGTIVTGIVLLIVFVWFESRATRPALDVKLLRNKAFAAGTVSVTLSFFALTGGTFLMVFYVQGIRGYTPFQLGLVLLPAAVGTVFSATQSGRLVGRFGPRVTVTIGLIVLAVSFTWQALLEAHTALWLVEYDLGMTGLGLGLIMGATTTTTMAVVAPEKAGIGAGVNNTLRQIGAALGIAVLGSVLSVRYRSQMDGSVQALPAELRGPASESLGGTADVVQELQRSTTPVPVPVRESIPGLLAKAQNAYMSAMLLGFVIAVGALAVAAIVAAVWLPGDANISRLDDEHL
ncbi:DHA2 family efflux MFS transporter permease subunit [Streptomyces sp. NPDC001177]